MSEAGRRAKVVKIEVKRIVDEYPDLSFLETTPEYHYGVDGYNWRHVSEEDRKKVIEQYGSIWNACVVYADQDRARLDAYNRGTWWMIGIKAVATIHIPLGDGVSNIQTIESAGLWGIESDSGDDYLQEVGKGQVEEVKGYLGVLCVEGLNDCDAGVI